MGDNALRSSMSHNSGDEPPRTREKPLLTQTHNAMPMSVRIKRQIKIKSPTAARRGDAIERSKISAYGGGANFTTSLNVFRSLDPLGGTVEKMPRRFDDGVHIPQTSSNVSPTKLLNQRCADTEDDEFVESAFRSQLQPPRTAGLAHRRARF